jgi:hypothetical protein
MLTLQFVPYSEIEALNSSKRIKKLLGIVKDNNIVLLEGRLRKSEETDLIKKTMEEISEDFKGIELGVIFPDKKEMKFLSMLKDKFIKMMLGDRQGFTVIGPATIVKEIKQDPGKLQLLTQNEPRSRKKERKKKGK